MDIQSLLADTSNHSVPRRMESLESIHVSIMSGQIRLQSLPSDVIQLLLTDLLLLSSTASDSEGSLILSIFKRLLSPSLYPLLSSYLPPSHLETALSNAIPLQVQLVCQFLQFLSTHDTASLPRYLSSYLLSSIPPLFSHQDLSLVENLTHTLVTLASHLPSLSILFSHTSPLIPGLLSQLQDDTPAIRVFSLLSNISSLSQPAFQLCRDSGLLSVLSERLSSDDPLSFLCYLDTLHSFCLSPQGYLFFRDSGVLSGLLHKATAQNVGPALEMVRHDIIVFFFSLISLPHTATEGMLYYKPLFSHLFSLLEVGEERDVKVFLETLSYLSATQEGRVLLNQSTRVTEALSSCGGLLSSGSSDRRLQLLSTFSALLQRHVWMTDVEFYQQQTRDWFRCLGTEPLKRIFLLMRQPFSQLQTAAYSVCGALASWRWGQEDIRSCPGFLEFLINSESISGEELVYTRFEVISVLANSDTSLEILGASFYTKIREQFSLGPYHVKARYVVEVEND